MFCGNCGTPNNDSDVFCAGCGAKLIQEPVPAPAPVAPVQKKPNKKLIIGIAAAALVLIVALVLIFTLGGDDEADTPESVVTTYMESFLKADISNLLDLIPEPVLEENLGGKDGRDNWVEDGNDQLEYIYDCFDDYYDEWELTYEIKKVEDVDQDTLEEIQEYYDEEYDCTVSAAKEVTVRVTAKLDGSKEREDMTLYVIQIGGRWYFETEESDWFASLLYDFLYY